MHDRSSAWRLWCLVTLLALAGPSAVLAQATQPAQPADPVAPLHQAYRNMNQYHAQWLMSGDRLPPNQRGEMEVAFDRTNSRLLLRVQMYQQDGGQWKPMPQGILVVGDGENLFKAVAAGRQAQWQTREVPLTHALVYPEMGVALMPFRSLELPLLVSEYPQDWWVQEGEFPTARAVPATAETDLPSIDVMDTEGAVVLSMKYDPKTHVIQQARHGPVEYKLQSAKVNEPLDDAIFDARKHQEQMGIIEAK